MKSACLLPQHEDMNLINPSQIQPNQKLAFLSITTLNY
uniref:Uncharacterized protein n=1 Tax=Rhizophora mucronata TaxID=61149 RepID=A0A2P2PWN4_RHIMU